jgi:hypothetical protein
MFEDSFYPDNEKRALRAVQLGSDCTGLISQISSDKKEISVLLVDANKAIVTSSPA